MKATRRSRWWIGSTDEAESIAAAAALLVLLERVWLSDLDLIFRLPFFFPGARSTDLVVGYMTCDIMGVQGFGIGTLGSWESRFFFFLIGI